MSSSDTHQPCADGNGQLPTVTLTDTQDLSDNDQDMDSSQPGPAGRKRTATTGTIPASTGPYLTTGTVGQRSLSTPNLHADNSLITSPANSPPASPGLPAIAAVADPTAPPALSLDGSDSQVLFEITPVFTLSPITSPSSSPRLTPRMATAPPMSPRAPSPGDRRSSSSKPKSSLGPDGKTLKSSKNKTVHRASVVSMFDTTSSSMTLPTNFARKGSLPQDAANAGKNTGLAGLFVTQPQDLTSTPFSLTLAEFRLNDIYPKRQRRLLTMLHRMDGRLRQEGVIKKLTKEQLKGKPGTNDPAAKRGGLNFLLDPI
ncbi:hypothetical protein B0O80DRAFT_425162 [Mortierella sp. GBAus27b]|nr:hypothetical protein B0O80DRAFT_425162 [Mortierella sp. GBAus27b]